MARLLDLPPMPWQSDLYDVTHEVDGRGRLWYRIVVVVVPRQQGKSSATNAVMVRRSVLGRNMTTVYTAQDRSIAAERLIEQLYERQLRPSPLGPAVEARRANGSERLTFSNGSRVILVAPHERSAHGMTLDLAMIDEAWAQKDMSLPQAFSPAMVTRPDAQLWIVSTVGDGSDSLLAHYQAAGAAALTDPDSRLCYVEYSAAPEADPDDPAVWLGCMPAIGHTIDLDTIRAERAGLPPMSLNGPTCAAGRRRGPPTAPSPRPPGPPASTPPPPPPGLWPWPSRSRLIAPRPPLPSAAREAPTSGWSRSSTAAPRPPGSETGPSTCGNVTGPPSSSSTLGARPPPCSMSWRPSASPSRR